MPGAKPFSKPLFNHHGSWDASVARYYQKREARGAREVKKSLTTHYSLLTTHYSLLTAHCSLFSMVHSYCQFYSQ